MSESGNIFSVLLAVISWAGLRFSTNRTERTRWFYSSQSAKDPGCYRSALVFSACLVQTGCPASHWAFEKFAFSTVILGLGVTWSYTSLQLADDSTGKGMPFDNFYDSWSRRPLYCHRLGMIVRYLYRFTESESISSEKSTVDHQASESTTRGPNVCVVKRIRNKAPAAKKCSSRRGTDQSCGDLLLHIFAMAVGSGVCRL